MEIKIYIDTKIHMLEEYIGNTDSQDIKNTFIKRLEFLKKSRELYERDQRNKTIDRRLQKSL